VSKGRTADAQKSIQRALGRTIPLDELLVASAAEQSVEKNQIRDLFEGVHLRRTLFCGLFFGRPDGAGVDLSQRAVPY
jgi:putative MFS transporter